MNVLALGALALAIMVAFGRRPLLARASGRLLAGLASVLITGGAVFVILRGSWIDGLILLAASAWLAATAARTRPAPVQGLGLAESRSMLGVGEGASREEIEAAYRRLMQRVHPDKGGAPGLAAQLNAARERLLRS